MAVEAKGSVVVDGQKVPMVPLGTTDIADNAVTTAKIPDSAITSLKLSSALVPYIGVYGYGEYGRCVYNFLT